MIYGYARVSTVKQYDKGNSIEAQVKALEQMGAEIVYKDKFTGKKTDRPEFNKLIEQLKSGDTLIVTKLDRLGRSITATNQLITELINKGVIINILNFGVLDNSSLNTFMRNILLAFAEFERNMIIERTQEGKEIARQNPDYRDGRKPKYNTEKINFAIHLLENHSYKETELLTGISKSTLYRSKMKKLMCK